MTHNSSTNPDVDGCFEAALAIRLGTRKHLKPQQAISEFGGTLSPEERLELAIALYWEFCGRLCRVRHDEQSLQILQEKYNQIRDFVAPIYRLPPEILAEIFTIDLEGRQSPIRLMLVCQYWCTVVDGLASMWESLKLGTWTSPARVERSLKRAGWLNVVIHTEEDIEKGQGDDEAYIALASAAASASRWKRLTVESLPHERLEEVAHPIPSLAYLSPIRELNYLKTTSQAESSPLLTQLLDNIGSAAVGNLSTMETTSLYTIQHLLQPAYIQSFHTLTTLHVAVRKTGNSVDLLPHLSKLEVLHITNVSLPSYAGDLNLPLTSSLCQLYLRAVSVQWMGGRIFPKLQSCAITSPPRYPPLSSDIDCPICTDFEFRNWNVRVAGQFRTPMIHSLVIKSNEWTPVRGSEQVILLCSVGLGFQLQPRVLHLAAPCKECVLLSILELLPALEELRLDIERPCALGRRFFTSLLAKPTNDLKSDIGREWEALPMGIESRKSTICPFLRRLELKYERWIRQTDQLDILPPLMALSWSREGTTTPLESFRLCFKDDNAQWQVLEPTGFDISNGILDIPQIQPYLPRLLDYYPFFTSCVMATATSMISREMGVGQLGGFQHLLQLFGFYFRHLCILRIEFSYDEFPNFEILPNFFRLEELDLSSVDIPSYSIQTDLPFVRTLRRLSLRSTTLTWMDGRGFPRLKRFYLCDDRPVHFPKTASLPVCTHLKYIGNDYNALRSAFLVPALIVFQQDDNIPTINDVESLKKGIIKTSKNMANKPYNILLVGETGVGKSSVLEFIANVLTGNDIGQYNFDILDRTNEQGGSDNQSQTNAPRLYEFMSRNGIMVRILDTPGLADTRSMQQDELHKRSIATQSKEHIDSISAVLIVANGAVPRVTVGTDYALSTLSSMLPKSMAHNVSFMFTNVLSPLHWNFFLETVPSELRGVPQFLLNNPIVLQRKYLKLKDDPKLKKMMVDLRNDIKASEQNAMQMLVELFDWLDGLEPQVRTEVVMGPQKRNARTTITLAPMDQVVAKKANNQVVAGKTNNSVGTNQSTSLNFFKFRWSRRRQDSR